MDVADVGEFFDSDSSELGDLFPSDEEEPSLVLAQDEQKEREEIEEFLRRATDLEKNIQTFSKTKVGIIPGLTKFAKTVRKEIEFLNELLYRVDGHPPSDSSSLLLSRPTVATSNLPYQEAVFSVVKAERDVAAIGKRFSISGGSAKRGKTVEIDVVSENGTRWVKVKAQNPAAIQRACDGLCSKQKSVAESVQEWKTAAERHVIHFELPMVIVVFAKGVTQKVVTELRKLDVIVKGRVLTDYVFDEMGELQGGEPISGLENEWKDQDTQNAGKRRRMNLDVTALVTYVSDVTNGGDNNFAETIYQTMAGNEKKLPALPILEKFMKGRELLVCETSYNRFMKLLGSIGGPGEKQRAKELLSRTTRVPDQPTERAMKLTGSGVSMENKIVFGTGDALKATTLTANMSFVRSAQTKNVAFSVFRHPPRSLTEDAKRIQL